MTAWDELLYSKFGDDVAKNMISFRQLVWATAGYTPTPIQQEVAEAARLTKLLSGGVRAGKSLTSAMLMADFIAMDGETIWLVGNTFEDAREEFLYLYEPLAKLGLVTGKNVSMPDIGRWKMVVSGGATIRTKSSGDIAKLASIAPVAQLYTEVAQQNPDIFDKALERALQHDGFVVFSGTLEASKQLEFTNLLIKWDNPKDDSPSTPQSWSMPTWSNTISFPGGKKDPKFRRMIENMTPDKFDERVAAIPYKPEGLVHRSFSDKNVVPLQLDPTMSVHLAIDPGYTTYSVLFLQRHGEYVHVLDEIYRHEALTHDIVEETMAHPLYQYVDWGLIDIGALAHQAQESVWEVWRRLTGKTLVTIKTGIDDGVDAVEMRLKVGEDGQPRLLVSDHMPFDMGRNGKANSLRAEFASYRWPKFKVNKTDGIKPIDSNNHAIKALAYYLFFWYRQEHQERERPNEGGNRAVLPSRLGRYMNKPSYEGNKTRWQGIKRGRRKSGRV